MDWEVIAISIAFALTMFFITDCYKASIKAGYDPMANKPITQHCTEH
jgi:hypothetical protein